MYLGQCVSCRRSATRRLNGLGFWEALLPIAGQVITSAFSDKGRTPTTTGTYAPEPQAQPVNVITTVSPQVSTNVSPSISPVFQQQWQPSSSPATASTVQSVPSPIASAVNNSLPVPYSTTDPIAGMYAAGLIPAAQPAQSSMSKWLLPLALFGAAGFIVIRNQERG